MKYVLGNIVMLIFSKWCSGYIKRVSENVMYQENRH